MIRFHNCLVYLCFDVLRVYHFSVSVRGYHSRLRGTVLRESGSPPLLHDLALDDHAEALSQTVQLNLKLGAVAFGFSFIPLPFDASVVFASLVLLSETALEERVLPCLDFELVESRLDREVLPIRCKLPLGVGRPLLVLEELGELQCRSQVGQANCITPSMKRWLLAPVEQLALLLLKVLKELSEQCRCIRRQREVLHIEV